MTFQSSAGPLELVSANMIVDLVSTDRVHNQVHQYHTLNPGPFVPPIQTLPTPTFSTQTKTIEHYGDKEHFILNSFTKDLFGRATMLKSNPKSFIETVEDASIECLQNFGSPTHAVLFDSKTIIVGDFNADTIVLKELAPNYGALVVFKPHNFTIALSPEAYPHAQGIPRKYSQYVSNVLIMDTIKKLGLV